MVKAIAITRLERSASELREIAVRTEDSDVVRRLLAIALLVDGWPRGEAAIANGMDRQTLCDWVHRYNAIGVGGLTSSPRSGRPPALNAVQMAELKEMVIRGPDPEKDGVVRWRCIDLRVKIAAHFSVTFHPRSVAKLLHKLGMTRLQPRPYHPQKDAAAQEAFKKTSPAW
jgi:transposase